MSAARSLRALVAALGLVATGAAPAFLVGSLAPELRREFTFGALEIGVAVGGFFVISSAVSPAAGRLVDRLGTNSGVRLTVALAVACPIAIALFARSTTTLVGLLTLGALANAGSGPAASGLLTRDVPVRRQGLGYGALAAGAPAAALLAGLALPVVAEPFGWRSAFALTAALAALSGLLAGILATERAASIADRETALAGSSWRVRWGKPHTLAVAAALANSGAVGMTAFLVIYAIEAGLSGAQAGLLLAGVSATAAASRVGSGVAADRVGERTDLYLVLIFLVSSLGFLLLTAGTGPSIVAGALLAGGLGWGWGGLLNLSAVRARGFSPSEAVGISLTGVFVGAFVGPLATGLIADGAGYPAAWTLWAAMQLAAAATVIVARRPGGERRSGNT